ncbi:hypothetical protein [Propionicimonas sp. T2.31MG-18]
MGRPAGRHLWSTGILARLILEISTGPDPAKLSAHGSISLG